MKKPLDERITHLKAQKQKLELKLNVLSAKAKKDDRKRDTRRKIVVGAAVIAAMEKDSELAAKVRRILAATVTRPQDKDVLGELLDAAPAPKAPEASAA